MVSREEELLLTPEERKAIANSVPVEEYATSTQYWDAIIEALLKAQIDKLLSY